MLFKKFSSSNSSIINQSDLINSDLKTAFMVNLDSIPGFQKK